MEATLLDTCRSTDSTVGCTFSHCCSGIWAEDFTLERQGYKRNIDLPSKRRLPDGGVNQEKTQNLSEGNFIGRVCHTFHFVLEVIGENQAAALWCLHLSNIRTAGSSLFKSLEHTLPRFRLKFALWDSSLSENELSLFSRNAKELP